MNAHLIPRLEDLLRQKVASGRYSSANEFVQETLRLLAQEDHLRGQKPAPPGGNPQWSRKRCLNDAAPLEERMAKPSKLGSDCY